MLISVATRVHTKNRDFECSVTRIAIAIKNEHARNTSPLQRMVNGGLVRISTAGRAGDRRSLPRRYKRKWPFNPCYASPLAHLKPQPLDWLLNRKRVRTPIFVTRGRSRDPAQFNITKAERRAAVCVSHSHSHSLTGMDACHFLPSEPVESDESTPDHPDAPCYARYRTEPTDKLT
jgi:hypothetical protein